MKKRIAILLMAITCSLSCQKAKQERPGSSSKSFGKTFSLEEVKTSYHPDTSILIDWKTARLVNKNKKDFWIVDLPGRPLFKGLRLGYRRAVFSLDITNKVQQRILECIPDAMFLQQQGSVNEKNFTGRIFTYDDHYRLLSGSVYSGGNQIGLIKTRKEDDHTGTLHTNLVDVSVTCEWVNENYVDAEGNAVIYSEKICHSIITDSGDTGILNGSGGDGSGTAAAGSGGGASASSGPGTAPAQSNLPGENNPKVIPKDLMLCFADIPDKGATMTVTVYVQEPWPGTTFNIGPNSVGHTAIGLTKRNGNQSVTQVLGFYPDASGKDKSHAPSKIVNNGGDLNFNASISYSVSADNFKRISDYVANPPTVYDIIKMNCTTFVNGAVTQGGIVLPNSSTTAGYDSEGNEYKTMAPATLGYNIEKMDGKPNVNANGGTTPQSKGSCNPSL